MSISSRRARSALLLFLIFVLFNFVRGQDDGQDAGQDDPDPPTTTPAANTFTPLTWQLDNYTDTPQNTPPSSYWVQNIQRRGTIPYGEYSKFNKTANSNYVIFRNVKDYGAVGDGKTDDTAAIQAAVNGTKDALDRCIQGCDSSTVSPAIVYFPSGTYLISSGIVMLYYTQMIGDATDLPVLKGSSGFNSIGILDADHYNNGPTTWYTNQNNFYRQVRNFIIDMTDMQDKTNGIHWQVAQATSLQNIVFKMKPGSNQCGIFMENGSANFLGDLIFIGGGGGIANGCMFVGNQQFTVRNVTFNGCGTAIYQNWGWVWTYKDIVFENVGTGLNMTALGSGGLGVGSVILQDSVFINTQIGIVTAWSSNSTPISAGALVLDNVDLTGTQLALNSSNGFQIQPQYIQSYMQGPVYTTNFTQQTYNGKVCLEPYSNGTRTQLILPPEAIPPRPSVLVDKTSSNGKYFTRYKPQYEGVDVSKFVSVKANQYANATGDGITDDTMALQTIFTSVAGTGQIVYFDHGAYLVSDTVYIPPNLNITGEIWPMIMVDGSSPTFLDPSNPQPVIRVGNPGDVGYLEMSDLVFETLGPAPGAIIMEWNLEASAPGDAGMWDVHWRIGGSAGTQLQADRCLKNQVVAHGANQTCFGAFLLLHITASASLYMENNWGWVADHELDMEPYIGQQIDVYNGRGVLVEATKGVWMVGTAFEHSQFYNYQIANAQNVYMGAIQSETAYMQGNPNALAAFTPNASWSDPTFDTCVDNTCYKTYGLRITDSNEIFVYGAGLYSFFDNYDQGCLITENCQEFMIQLDNSSEIYLYNPNTKASANIMAIDGQAVLSGQNLESTFCQGVTYYEEPGYTGYGDEGFEV